MKSYDRIFFLILSILPVFIHGAVFCSVEDDQINLNYDDTKSYSCAGTAYGQTHFFWRTRDNFGDSTGLSESEYYVRQVQDGTVLYSSTQQFSQGSGNWGPVGSTNTNEYQAQIQCSVEWFLNDCDGGTFSFRMVYCGCPNGITPIVPCNVDSFDSAANAECFESCENGYYFDIDEGGCTPCPNEDIIATTNIDYSGAVGLEGCSDIDGTGFWSLAAQGSVAADGTTVNWLLTRSDSVSEGVERTSDYAQSFGSAQSETTSFETSISAGWSTSASVGMFGSSVGVEASVDFTSTTGEERSWTVSQESTNSIGRAVSSVITSTETVTCQQTCGPDPNDPTAVQGFIYNWVQAIYDKNSNGVLHYVRTCATVCKNTRPQPQCPPGFCQNRECTICLRGAFADPEVDRLASYIPTGQPTFSPPTTEPPTEEQGGDSGGSPLGLNTDRYIRRYFL